MDSGGCNPIHTTRVINRTLKFSINSSPLLDYREAVKQCLEKLRNAGDLVSFSHGRWLPAKLREIIIDRKLEESLMVGGIPSNEFPKIIESKITHHKQFRRIESGLLDKVCDLPKNTLNFWAQIPVDSLDVWAEKFKRIPLQEYVPVGDRQYLEIYIPNSQKNQNIQNFRWKREYGGITGKYLCKSSSVTGTGFHLAEITNGAVVGLSNPLRYRDYSRLLYAEDSLHGTNVIANTRIKKGELMVKLHNMIPLGEHTVFDALGDLSFDSKGLIVWTFAKRYQEVVLSALKGLRINIEG